MVFTPFPADLDAAAREVGLPPPSEAAAPPPGYREPADSRRTGPAPTTSAAAPHTPTPERANEPDAIRAPVVTAGRSLASACEAFARAAREFEDHPGAYAEHLDHLQTALKRFEVATLPPGDEHVDDYNGRLHNVVAGFYDAKLVSLARVRAYLDRSTEPHHYGAEARRRWSRHFTYESGHELWLHVREQRPGSSAEVSLTMPARSSLDDLVGPREVAALVGRIALVEDRHALLVITDITGPACAP